MFADPQVFMAESIFTKLTAERQLKVFRTIQEGIENVPPRPKATFANVCLAYAAEQFLLDAARMGLLDHGKVIALQQHLEDAGGVLCHGLSARGEGSVEAFRESTFSRLESLLPPSVQASALNAINVQIKASRPSTIEELFKCLKNYLDPIIGVERDDLPPIAMLKENMQIRLFDTLAHDGVDSKKLVTQSSVLSALLAEQSVVQSAKLGQLKESDLVDLERRIDVAGGVISPGLRSKGPTSIASFRSFIFGWISDNLPIRVQPAALWTFNSLLAHRSPETLDTVLNCGEEFIEPLRQSNELFTGLHTDRQVRVFETLRDSFHSHPELHKDPFSHVFASVVKVFDLEQQVVAAPLINKSFSQLIFALDQSLETIGRLLATDQESASADRIHRFCDGPLAIIKSGMSADLVQACFSALNSHLAAIHEQYSGTGNMLVLASAFLEPITKSLELSSLNEAPNSKFFAPVDGEQKVLRQAEDFLPNPVPADQTSSVIYELTSSGGDIVSTSSGELLAESEPAVSSLVTEPGTAETIILPAATQPAATPSSNSEISQQDGSADFGYSTSEEVFSDYGLEDVVCILEDESSVESERSEDQPIPDIESDAHQERHESPVNELSPAPEPAFATVERTNAEHSEAVVVVDATRASESVASESLQGQVEIPEQLTSSPVISQVDKSESSNEISSPRSIGLIDDISGTSVLSPIADQPSQSGGTNPAADPQSVRRRFRIRFNFLLLLALPAGGLAAYCISQQLTIGRNPQRNQQAPVVADLPAEALDLPSRAELGAIGNEVPSSKHVHPLNLGSRPYQDNIDDLAYLAAPLPALPAPIAVPGFSVSPMVQPSGRQSQNEPGLPITKSDPSEKAVSPRSQVLSRQLPPEESVAKTSGVVNTPPQLSEASTSPRSEVTLGNIPKPHTLQLSMNAAGQVSTSGDVADPSVRRHVQQWAARQSRPPAGLEALAISRIEPPITRPATSPAARTSDPSQLSDPFAELPDTLREPIRKQVQNLLVSERLERRLRVLPAGSVTLSSPLAAARRVEHIPVVMFTDGQIVLLKPPSDSSLMASIQAWADAQPLPPEGFVSPVVLSFQPRA